MNKALKYLLPAGIILSIFFAWPILNAFILAFTFNGTFTLSNFTLMFQDPNFQSAVINTILYVILVVPITIALSLACSLAIHSVSKGKKIFETIYFLPYVTSSIAIGVVWRIIYHPNFGLLNAVIAKFGGNGIAWIDSPEYAFMSLVIFSIWSGLAFNIIIFLASLRNIKEDYYKVADIFGASSWTQFRKITLPLLGPTIILTTLIAIMNSFKVYAHVVGLFGTAGAGPANSAITLVYYIYNMMYGVGDFHFAAAGALVLFIIIFVTVLIQRYINKKIENY